ncbi:hypothetical protein HN51_048724 [Arachis hypogaea]|nr:uncharacterized protein DS421_12g380160 [Arachis hypogaea]
MHRGRKAPPFATTVAGGCPAAPLAAGKRCCCCRRLFSKLLLHFHHSSLHSQFYGLHVKIEVAAEPSEFSAGIEAAVRSIWKLLLCRSILFTTICGCCRDPYGCLRISMVAAN